MTPHLLASQILTAKDVAALVAERTGSPCGRHRLRYLIRIGRVPRPIAVLGRNRLWTRDQLAERTS